MPFGVNLMTDATVFVHPFERAGLGIAPFICAGHREIVFQIPGEPARAGGSCDYCGTGIRDAFIIRSRDGREFKVGSDCVRKVEAGGSRLLADIERKAKAVIKARKAASLEARETAARKTLGANPELFTNVPHPSEWFAAKGKTLRDSILFLLERGGAAGRTRACIAIEHALPDQGIGLTMTYRYRTTLRPAAFGGLPMGVNYKYVEAPFDGLFGFPSLPVSSYRYGVVETDRELTPEELRHFDIERVE